MNGKFESTSNNYDESNLNRLHSVLGTSMVGTLRFAHPTPLTERGRRGRRISVDRPFWRKVIYSWQRFDLRRHVGGACHPVCRVGAFEDPDGAVRPGALLVPGGAERLVTGETLCANLSRQHGLRCFGGNLLRPQLRAEKNSSDSHE